MANKKALALIEFCELQVKREEWLKSLLLDAFLTFRKQQNKDLKVLTHNLKIGGV